MDAQVLVVPTQLTEPRRDEVLGHGHARADRQLCPTSLPERLGGVEQPPRVGDHLACPVHDHGALRRQRRAARPPSEQRHPELALEPAHRPARVGLGHPLPSCRRAEAAEVVDGHEDGQHREVGPGARHAWSIWASLPISTRYASMQDVRLPGRRRCDEAGHHVDLRRPAAREDPSSRCGRGCSRAARPRRRCRGLGGGARRQPVAPFAQPTAGRHRRRRRARQRRLAQPTPGAGPRRGVPTTAAPRCRAARAPAGAQRRARAGVGDHRGRGGGRRARDHRRRGRGTAARAAAARRPCSSPEASRSAEPRPLQPSTASSSQRTTSS